MQSPTAEDSAFWCYKSVYNFLKFMSSLSFKDYIIYIVDVYVTLQLGYYTEAYWKGIRGAYQKKVFLRKQKEN